MNVNALLDPPTTTATSITSTITNLPSAFHSHHSTISVVSLMTLSAKIRYIYIVTLLGRAVSRCHVKMFIVIVDNSISYEDLFLSA